MLVYYVEGDRGHLMNEVVGKQQQRTVARGGCMSFVMPWEDIVDAVRKVDSEPLCVPHGEDTLRYFLRVHLNVAGQDFTQYLKQVQVRPWIVLKLLYFLIEHDHVASRGRGAAESLRRQMRAKV